MSDSVSDSVFPITLNPSLAMASSPAGRPGNRDAEVTNTLHCKDDRFKGIEGDGAVVRAIQAPSIEVGDQTDNIFNLGSEVEDDNATASLASSIYSTIHESGRRYAVFGDVRYPLPIDETEQSRGDMKHAMFMLLMQNKLFFSPIGNYPQKILDIGTGTGIWAVEVGDRYPSAKVRGIDIAPMQPKSVPPNVSFLVDDCEKDWIERDADLAHFRSTIVIFKDTSKVLGHAFESLRPGGWIELHEVQPVPMCDGETMPDDDPVKYICETAERAFETFGMKTTLPANLEPYLHKAGFENIHCQIIKVL
ncbi:hypothetical protein E4U61_005811 [Claviceps capensis]|nr:hypothetical protein E4U61_005811 [Claviceps capensis]